MPDDAILLYQGPLPILGHLIPHCGFLLDRPDFCGKHAREARISLGILARRLSRAAPLASHFRWFSVPASSSGASVTAQCYRPASGNFLLKHSCLLQSVRSDTPVSCREGLVRDACLHIRNCDPGATPGSSVNVACRTACMLHIHTTRAWKTAAREDKAILPAGTSGAALELTSGVPQASVSNMAKPSGFHLATMWTSGLCQAFFMSFTIWKLPLDPGKASPVCNTTSVSSQLDSIAHVTISSAHAILCCKRPFFHGYERPCMKLQPCM